MIGNIRSGVRAFDDGGTPPGPQDLTEFAVASAGGVMPPFDHADLLRLWVTLGAIAVDGLNITLTPARRATVVTAGVEQTRNSDGVTAGVETLSAGIYRASFAAPLSSVTVPIDIRIVPGYAYLVAIGHIPVKIAGGLIPTVLATADFIET